ncbi:hypothetical protein [Gracilimonas amylolytica]|uniref:hypothetical protein n=1 Tax=Gracilimonas amylolytica TaxID=1749045 RepID=UPI0012FFE84D|nr:hypothetical protein [Gracilimonas amylolytica]
MLINKAVFISPVFWFLIPAHIEVMIFGWIIQFTLGVAYWILPRYLEDKGRGSKPMAYLIPIFLNIGIVTMVSSDLLNWNGMKLTGRLFELMAVLTFVILHWKRVVTYNK